MTPTLVGYNSFAFDSKPVVRARASALLAQGGAHLAHYGFRPFAEHRLDLCDARSSPWPDG